jgi:transcriptional pleiotropic repressor
MLSESTTGYVAFDELCDNIGVMLHSDMYVLSKRGKVLAAKHDEEDRSLLDEKSNGRFLNADYNEKFLTFYDTKENLVNEDVLEIFGSDYEYSDRYHIIIPVIFGGNRVATVILVRQDDMYSDEDIAIAEYGATVVGLEVSRSIALEEEADSRERNAVNMALETLSYSELDAVVKIFGELEGDEGLLVASKVADKFNITRSVIVNALRKLESAGVIESRSLGMKGTRIKITNEFLRDQIDKIDI